MLLCLVVCLTLLASFLPSFLPSHLSLKHVHVVCVELFKRRGINKHEEGDCISAHIYKASYTYNIQYFPQDKLKGGDLAGAQISVLCPYLVIDFWRSEGGGGGGGGGGEEEGGREGEVKGGSVPL